MRAGDKMVAARKCDPPGSDKQILFAGASELENSCRNHFSRPNQTRAPNLTSSAGSLRPKKVVNFHLVKLTTSFDGHLTCKSAGARPVRLQIHCDFPDSDLSWAPQSGGFV